MENDKAWQLLRDVIASFDGAGVSVVVATSGCAGAGPARAGVVRTKDGRSHAVDLLPMRGAVGLAAVARLAGRADAAVRPTIVVAAALGQGVRAALRERGYGYLDLAGNGHLELDGGNVTVHIDGRRRPPRPPGAGTLRAAGYRVLFALLAEPCLLTATIRAIAGAAAASRHAAQCLLARLRDEGLIVRTDRSGHVFAPTGRVAGIDRFAAAWADVLRASLRIGRFRMRAQDPAVMKENLEVGLRAAGVPFGFGGAIGAARWVRQLLSEEVVVHVADLAPELSRSLDMVPDPHGPITVFRTMSALDLSSGEPEAAHPLLTYAELARSADPRARETARLLLASRLLEQSDGR